MRIRDSATVPRLAVGLRSTVSQRPAAVDATPEHDALVAVLVTADDTPKTTQVQTLSALMRTPSQSMSKRWVMPLNTGPTAREEGLLATVRHAQR